jgi:hypothetical protein
MRLWLLLACGACSAPVVVEDTARLTLRDTARLELEASCGDCHVSFYPSSLPGALAVFDLSEPEWSAGLSKSQLADVSARMGDVGAVASFTRDEIARLCAR